MIRRSPALGVVTAGLTAGPLLVFTTFLLEIIVEGGVSTAGAATDVLVWSALAVLIGGFPGLLINAVGTLLMSFLADRVEAARRPLVWMLAGAVCGVALASLFGAEFREAWRATPMILTSAICAFICRFSLRWD